MVVNQARQLAMAEIPFATRVPFMDGAATFIDGMLLSS
jgi:hypothetical protein